MGQAVAIGRSSRRSDHEGCKARTLLAVSEMIMTFSRLMLTCAPALLVTAAACRNDAPSQATPNPVPANSPAQTGTPPAATPPPAPASPATPGSTAHGTQPTIGASPAAASRDAPPPLTDGQVAAVTDGLHRGEIEQAKLARSKSKNKQVLSFASMMIDHHGQAQRQQAALKETPEASPLATELQTESQKTLAGLRQAANADFDRAYLDAQVEGHQKALDTLKARLLPSAKAPELTKYLRELQPKIEQHLARARTLRDALASKAPITGERSTTRGASLREETPSPSSPSVQR
jgi:putative membrane protein